MKTYQNWIDQKKDFMDFIADGDEIDSSMYFYFLEILPPRIMKHYGFLLGEPYNHDKNGNALYESFYESPSNKYFYGGLKTVKQFTDSNDTNYTLTKKEV